VSNAGANLNNLDMLRAVAVLCVIVAHLPGSVLGLSSFWTETLGRFGVFSFFVHTALVLMMSLDRSKASRPALDFYIRRVFRIYPLSVFVVLAVLAFHIPFMPDHQYEFASANRIIQNLLLVQNLGGSKPATGRCGLCRTRSRCMSLFHFFT
jgi:peptidoglycan/LPS O-acetylase OafA/YrhL